MTTPNIQFDPITGLIITEPTAPVKSDDSFLIQSSSEPNGPSQDVTDKSGHKPSTDSTAQTNTPNAPAAELKPTAQSLEIHTNPKVTLLDMLMLKHKQVVDIFKYGGMDSQQSEKAFEALKLLLTD